MNAIAIGQGFGAGVSAPSEGLDDATISRCRAGDRQAFRRFVLVHQRLVFAFLGRMLGARAPIEDIAQEAFLRAFRSLPSFDPQGPARLSTWMLAIARHAALDHLRRRPGEVAFAEVDAIDFTSPEVEASRRELGRTLSRAAAALPLEQREAFVLFEVHGLSLEEIALVVEAPVPTVKTRCFRAREKLREALSQTHRDEQP